MKLINTFILLLLLSAFNLLSQSFVKDGIYADGRLEVGATGYFTKYFGEFTDNKVGLAGGFFTKYYIPYVPEFSIGVRAGFGRLQYSRRYKNRFGDEFYRQFPKSSFPDANVNAYDRYTKVTTVDFLLFVNLFPRSQINYYLFAGYSVLSFQNQDILNSPLDGGGYKFHYKNFKDEDEFDYHWIGGLGADYFITRDFSAGLFLAYRALNTDLLDGFAQVLPNGEPSNTDAYGEFGLKVSYYFFSDNDPDEDGITNIEESKYGTNPHKYDTDDDGVSDKDEIKLFKSNPLLIDSDSDGLSDSEEIANSTNPNDADTDKDGLADYEEVMLLHSNPNEADSDRDRLSDKSEIQNGSNPMNGDTDGDGIGDKDDKCPSVFGIRILNGCPQTEALVKEVQVKDTVYLQSKPDTVIIVQEIEKIKKGDTYKPKGINFLTGSAEIRIESELVLDDIVDWLEKNPKIKVEIQGHTDQEGSTESNKKLSIDRAEAVMHYLINHGISPTRLSAVGFGETKPIDNSGTPKAMAKNRRIEFKVIEN